MRTFVAALGVMLLVSCAGAPSSTGQAGTAGLVFLTRDGCANTARLRANLDDALRALGRPTDYAVIDLDSLPDSDLRRGYPTPTVLYANRDLFGMPEPTPPVPGAT